MILVDTGFCPNVSRNCLKDEYTKANKITICHKFAEKPPVCQGKERRQRFCIDTYEYPNKKGARSPVMVDWHDAMAICQGDGKRLCYESEWTAACEGPDKLPFPYGYTRDPTKCNINNPYVEPSLERMYSKNPAIFDPELTHLDQGVPSGSREGCVSGFGVHDQPGNVDEWVILDTPRGKGGSAGLKGGAWGYVRNACRPVTTSHAAEFTYYFVSFRCCADAKPGGAAEPTPWAHPPLPKSRKTPETAFRGWTPKTKED
ncbi:MAG: SUMF1/EgtB/PvdO family nonheme iron enzyme [Polyangiaceae bacterium]